ncbi:hypothetical protein BKA65DRAFT_483051 [Rhexocercosporidium sp. MPI-PUGE-AT-0058]|nr:hypothetical protein BKA65DRAFT_483051 [Rhexocercosporidium sp. MPI-PUGE-AT-0058]
MDPPAPNRKTSMAISGSSESSVASAATICERPSEDHVRPSAEEWYPRLHLGWNHKECVDVYCYFKSRPFNSDFKIEWAIHPLGPPFHGKRQPMSFEYTLQLVDTQSKSGTVKNAVAIGLSTQYFWQKKFKEDARVYEHVEPTPEEILTSWENHSLDISEDGNVEKVKDAVMSTFGFYISKGAVALLSGFSALNKVSVFETNTWRQMMCFKCCPRKDILDSPDAPISQKENPRKRKNNDSQDDNQPSPKRSALSVREGSSNRAATSAAVEDAVQASIPREDIEATSPAATGANLVSTTTTDSNQASSASEDIEAAAPAQSPAHETLVSSALSRTLTISSWLRLLPALTLQSGKNSTTIQKWLKDGFAIDVTLDDITRMTESAKVENISPLQTAEFKCMIAIFREDLGAMLMSPHIPTGIDMTRRGSLRGLSGNVEAAVRRASGASQSEGNLMVKSGLRGISNCA